MFKCSRCQKSTNRMNRITVETREVEYYCAVLKKKGISGNKRRRKNFYFSFNRQEVKELLALRMADKEVWKLVQEKTTSGVEIVKEHQVCDECYEK